MKQSKLIPAWLRRLWLASLVVLLLIYVLLRGAWIYVRRGESALDEWFDSCSRLPFGAAAGQGGPRRG